ncbi:MAG: hypothetical protein FJY98_01610 [Candidatus Liptonbacteria bacterium]|nr:hypothetical protein [Candidatus Pacearchaeota archaeon]MBM3257005.1 hypothetical protein [Candidatus Liptonbacteria bacterium]
MDTEYIRLGPQELKYGKKSLLESQFFILNAMKHYNEYRRLRKEEFMLKVALKKSADDVMSSLNHLESLLPKASIKVEKSKHINTSHVKEVHSKQQDKVLALDLEINRIKQKLSALR